MVPDIFVFEVLRVSVLDFDMSNKDTTWKGHRWIPLHDIYLILLFLRRWSDANRCRHIALQFPFRSHCISKKIFFSRTHVDVSNLPYAKQKPFSIVRCVQRREKCQENTNASIGAENRKPWWTTLLWNICKGGKVLDQCLGTSASPRFYWYSQNPKKLQGVALIQTMFQWLEQPCSEMFAEQAIFSESHILHS